MTRLDNRPYKCWHNIKLWQNCPVQFSIPHDSVQTDPPLVQRSGVIMAALKANLLIINSNSNLFDEAPPH